MFEDIEETIKENNKNVHFHIIFEKEGALSALFFFILSHLGILAKVVKECGKQRVPWTSQ